MNLHEQFSQWRLAKIETGELGKSAGRDSSWDLFKEYKNSEKFETWMKDVNCVWVKRFFSSDNRECTEEEMLKQNVKYRMAQQKYQDTNRIERATFRKDARLHNAVEEYSKEIVRVLHQHDLSAFTIQHETLENKACGLVQLSDAHMNELISILGNKYDFRVAAKRLKRLAIQTKKYFVPFGIKNILLALTGDMMNSDRRLDELLNQATNRANASILTFFLFKQFILDLNMEFNVLIASVSGNESRIHEEYGFSEIIATNNYDITIENMLKIAFSNCKGISFVTGEASEKIIEVNGQNVLLAHGNGSLSKGNTQSAVQQKIGGYALKGIIIDFIIYGHVHCPNVSNHSARASSLAGSNSYNENELNLIGRASQNIYIFFEDKTRDSIVVDLQNTDSIQGYEIIEELECYNAKSAEKCKSNITILKVVV